MQTLYLKFIQTDLRHMTGWFDGGYKNITELFILRINLQMSINILTV
jgi:hypothetical protein